MPTPDETYVKNLQAEIALTKAKTNFVNIASWIVFWTPAVAAGLVWMVTR